MNIIRLISNLKFIPNFRVKNKKFIFHNILLIFIFSILYKNLALQFGNEIEKNELGTYEKSLYFTCVTHFGVGYGDIVPKTRFLRGFCIIHILLVFLIILY